MQKFSYIVIPLSTCILKHTTELLNQNHFYVLNIFFSPLCIIGSILNINISFTAISYTFANANAYHTYKLTLIHAQCSHAFILLLGSFLSFYTANANANVLIVA